MKFTLFLVASTTLFYIIVNFFFLRKVSFLSSSFVWHGRTPFPILMCTCNFGPLFYIFFNFSTWGGRGGEVSYPPLGNRNGCIRYFYQGRNTRKNIFGIYFPSIPLYCVIYLSRHLRCFYYQWIRIPYLLTNLFCLLCYWNIVHWYNRWIHR